MADSPEVQQGKIPKGLDLKLPQSPPCVRGPATSKGWRNRQILIMELQDQVVKCTDTGRNRDL